MFVLSVDPGVVNLGYSVAQVDRFEVIQLKNPLGYRFYEYGVFVCKSEQEAFNEKMNEETYQCLNFFTSMIDRWNITHVAWELPPGFGTMGQQSRIISNMTALKILVWQRGIPFFAVHPTSMKSKFTGNSKAEKSEVRAEVIKRWPQFNDDDKPKKERLAPDVFDAIGILTVAVEQGQWKRFGDDDTGITQL